MPYELRLDRNTVQTFETAEEALERAREAMATRPESEPEIRDLTTGKPLAPGASKAWRDELAGKVGF